MCSAPAEVLSDFVNASRQVPKHLKIGLLQDTDLIAKAASSPATLLILGESGTGKEIVAQLIHELSRRKGPFVPVNCGGLAPGIIESQLFGHERGAFTGATSDKLGVFECANNGTLFLDEIGNFPLEAQAMILRILEQQEVQRVGSNLQRKIDTRVIAATNIDLKTAIAEGKFRQDLYYRLDIISLPTKPLRDILKAQPLLYTEEAIDLLASFFIRQLAADHKVPAVFPSAMAREALLAYHWPGNIRQFRNVIERTLIMRKAGPPEILLEDLPPEIQQSLAKPSAPAVEVTDIETLCARANTMGSQFASSMPGPFHLMDAAHKIRNAFEKGVIETRLARNRNDGKLTATQLLMTYRAFLMKKNGYQQTSAPSDERPELS